MVRDVIAANVRRAGHHVLDAATGGQALTAVDGPAGVPEVAVLDIGLPDMDGFALVRALRDRPGLDTLPVIFLTGRTAEQDRAAASALGCTYLTKPFIASALLATIDQTVAPVAPPGNR